MSPSHDNNEPLSAMLVVVGGAVAVVGALALALLLSGDDARTAYETPRERPTERPTGPRTVAIEQAAWRIQTFPAGAIGKVAGRDRRRVRAQRPRLTALVRRVYDALFLRPSTRARALRRSFTRPAARSFARARGVGAPRGAADVRIVRRTAKVAVQARGARRAAARVVVRARGRVGARRWRVVHESTLWLERSRSRWRAIAFDVRQRPVRG